MAFWSPIPEKAWFVGTDLVLEWTILLDESLWPLNAVAGDPGTVEDITGWTIEFNLRQIDNQGLMVISKPAVLVDPTNGLCEVTILRADTVNIPNGDYYYALRRTDFGSATVLAYGEVPIAPAPPVPA